MRYQQQQKWLEETPLSTVHTLDYIIVPLRTEVTLLSLRTLCAMGGTSSPLTQRGKRCPDPLSADLSGLTLPVTASTFMPVQGPGFQAWPLPGVGEMPNRLWQKVLGTRWHDQHCFQGICRNLSVYSLSSFSLLSSSVS